MPFNRMGSFVAARSLGRSRHASPGYEKVATQCWIARRAFPERSASSVLPGYLRAAVIRPSSVDRVISARDAGASSGLSSDARKTGSLVYCAIPFP